jgi:type I restriction enzyme S subunit
MYFVRVRSEITDRLDAEFYNPTALLTIKMLGRNGPVPTLGEAIEDGYRVVYHGIDSCPPGAQSVPFLSPTQIDDQGAISFERSSIVPAYYQTTYPKGLAAAGDLLIEVKGNTSKVAVVPDTFPQGLMISGSLYKATIYKEFDSRFLLAFLRSHHGQILKERLTSNSIIDYIAKDALYGLPLPVLKFVAQRYIGDKIRQAEKLRERARELEKNFNKFIFSICSGADPQFNKGKHSRVNSSLIDRNLNPGLFNPDRLKVRDSIRLQSGVQLDTVATIETPSSDKYLPIDLYIGLDSISSGNCDLTPSTVLQAEVSGMSRKFLEGPVISKLRPYLNKVSYIPPEFIGAVGSTEILCVQPKQNISGWYLYGVLKLSSTMRQLNPIAAGSTLPRIDREDVLELIIPWTQNQKSRDAAGEQLKKAQQAYFNSKRLTEAAKFLVEALIENKIDEKKLKSAQEALELKQPDRNIDREILSRLSIKGMDVVGEPALFPDLDELYKAIDEANQPLPEVK